MYPTISGSLVFVWWIKLHGIRYPWVDVNHRHTVPFLMWIFEMSELGRYQTRSHFLTASNSSLQLHPVPGTFMACCLHLTATPWARQRSINCNVRVQSLSFRNQNFLFVNTMPQEKNPTPDSMGSIPVKTQTCKRKCTKLLSGYMEKMYVKYKWIQCLECILSSKYLYTSTQIFRNLKNTWNRKQSSFQTFQIKKIHLHWFFSLKILE